MVFADVDILIEENVFIIEISKTWRSKSVLFAIIMEYKRIFKNTISNPGYHDSRREHCYSVVYFSIQRCESRWKFIIQTDTSKSLLMNY